MGREKVGAVSPHSKRWNHNIQYHQVVLRAVPEGCRSGLDVGCGEGILARELRRVVPHVCAIDLDKASLDLAGQQDTASDIEYLLGDFLSHPFEPVSFDVIASVAALHHMDAVAALGRMRELLRPGGALAVIGLARSRYPADLPAEAAAAIGHALLTVTRTHREHSAPTVWPPPETYAGMRRIAGRMLPGARYRRHLLWRSSIVWSKPPQ